MSFYYDMLVLKVYQKYLVIHERD